MNIKKPKSHSPTFHDNTDKDIILVPPSVLENKLELLENYSRAFGTVGSDIGLAFVFLTAILTSDFKDFGLIKGATIEGAFYVGSIVMLIKTCRDLYLIVRSKIKSRKELVRNLLVDEDENLKE